MLLIRGGNVYLGQGRYEAGWDVLCDGSVIRAVGPSLSCEGGEIIEAGGRNVYPGAVLEGEKNVCFSSDDWYEMLRFFHFVLSD